VSTGYRVQLSFTTAQTFTCGLLEAQREMQFNLFCKVSRQDCCAGVGVAADPPPDTRASPKIMANTIPAAVGTRDTVHLSTMHEGTETV
jgi:hypothetical protein